MKTTKYDDHPISQIFPMMEETEKKKLGEDIKQNGQQELIILLADDDDGGKLKVLDGRNRQDACALVGIEPRFANWNDLSEEVRKAGPTAFVMGRNLHRRHLTPSQRATVAAESLPFFEKDAAARKAGALKQNAPSAPNGANEGDEKPEKKKSGAGKSSAAAGAALGVSARSVERASALKKRDPKKFEAVKAGKTTLGAASRDPKKEAAAAREALKASKGLNGESFLRDLFTKTRGGKLSVVVEGYKIVVTKLKEPKAPKPAKASAKPAAKKAAKKSAKKTAKK